MNELTKKQKIRRLAETAIMLALATILSELAVVKFPFGGSVTIFSQVPMIVISYRYGVKWGVFGGLTMGIIQMLFGMGNFAYVSGILAYLILIFADYIIAFGCLGLGGMFRSKVKEPSVSLALGGAVVSVIRFLCHFVSGVTIWGDYSQGAQAVWEYSLSYNGGYMLPELAITVFGCVVIGALFDLSAPEIKIRKRKK
ncbi:MAG: energy-coupled thiamine transporter ThiT [Ruminococcaceae bacterium]|nr:energy-coupled thiamine transporter ThiT [Oscillospiraceae bacterium]